MTATWSSTTNIVGFPIRVGIKKFPCSEIMDLEKCDDVENSSELLLFGLVDDNACLRACLNKSTFGLFA